jgi:hypothetical protein
LQPSSSPFTAGSHVVHANPRITCENSRHGRRRRAMMTVVMAERRSLFLLFKFPLLLLLVILATFASLNFVHSDVVCVCECVSPDILHRISLPTHTDTHSRSKHSPQEAGEKGGETVCLQEHAFHVVEINNARQILPLVSQSCHE